MRNKRWLYFIFPVLTALLGFLPGGVILVAMDPGGSYETRYPYFALTPVLAGNPASVCVAVCVLLSAILLLVWCVKDSFSAGNAAKYFQLAALCASIVPLFSPTVPAVLISIWLAIGTLVMFFAIRKRNG